MKKILLVSYYGFNDSLKYAKDSLEKLGYILENYPLFKYAYDTHDKLENYPEHFCEQISEINPDIILWWFIGIPEQNIAHVRNKFPNIYAIMFSWDDPYIWSEKSSQISEKAKYFDLVVSCCEETVPEYINHGSKKAIFCPPGYDPSINYPISISNEDYICDISICCTNLYKSDETYPDQYVNRKHLIDKLISVEKFNIHIYGPECLKILYPKQYKGFIKYSDLNEIYNKSKINLCTHVCHSKSKYLNERTILILGSGSLLMVDPVKNLQELINPDECVYFDKDKIVEQIEEILNNYERYNVVKSKGYEKSKEYTWDKWAQKIHNVYCDVMFNDKFYKEIYSLNDIDCRHHWETVGKNINFIPFSFKVPENFNYTDYSKDMNIQSNKEYLYWHYKLGYKLMNVEIIKKKEYVLQIPDKVSSINNINRLINDCHIDPHSWFKINDCFSSISSQVEVEENLKKLEEIVKQNPYSNVNELLSLHFRIAEE